MSCLNLRLPPAKKAWKSFTSKLHSKLLHKLYSSKSIKKNSKYRSSAKSGKSSRSVIFFDKKKRRGTLIRSGQGRSSFSVSSSASHHFHYAKNSSAPVYIDKLFREAPAVEVVATNAPAVKNVKVVVEDSEEAATGTSGKGGGGKLGEKESGGGGGADDMWESLGYGSPQMRGIDERAEQFISSFRAEMEQQEIIAKRFSGVDGR